MTGQPTLDSSLMHSQVMHDLTQLAYSNVFTGDLRSRSNFIVGISPRGSCCSSTYLIHTTLYSSCYHWLLRCAIHTVPPPHHHDIAQRSDNLNLRVVSLAYIPHRVKILVFHWMSCWCNLGLRRYEARTSQDTDLTVSLLDLFATGNDTQSLRRRKLISSLHCWR